MSETDPLAEILASARTYVVEDEMKKQREAAAKAEREAAIQADVSRSSERASAFIATLQAHNIPPVVTKRRDGTVYGRGWVLEEPYDSGRAGLDSHDGLVLMDNGIAIRISPFREGRSFHRDEPCVNDNHDEQIYVADIPFASDRGLAVLGHFLGHLSITEDKPVE